MIHFKSPEEIELIRKSSLLVGKTLAEIAKIIKPGITTKYLDKIAEEFIRDNDAFPGFKNYRGYPATLCVSVNETVVHGIPGSYEVSNGDIVSVDCGAIMNGYYGDSAYTFAVGEVDEIALKLMRVTKESLFKGIQVAVAGNRVGDIGYEIQTYVESFGYSVIRDLVGHGIGKKLHEDPQVANYGKRGNGSKLKEGMTICIEPMINLGKKEVYQEKDGWTIKTCDHQLSAHFEHAIAVRKGTPDILSTFEYIEEAIKNNNNLKEI